MAENRNIVDVDAQEIIGALAVEYAKVVVELVSLRVVHGQVVARLREMEEDMPRMTMSHDPSRVPKTMGAQPQ